MDKRPKRRKLLKEGVKMLGFMIGLFVGAFIGVSLCACAMQRQKLMSR